MSTDIIHRFTQVQGIRTHSMEAGHSGSTVVLLHGGNADSASLSWDLLIPELAKDHRVYAYDYPGFGESEPLRGGYSIQFYIDFLQAFLTCFGIEQASLLGISLGGSIALGYTLQHPQSVDRLVLVDSYGLQTLAPFHRLSYFLIKMPGLARLSMDSMRSRTMVKYSIQTILRRPGALTEELLDQLYIEANRPGSGKAWSELQQDEIRWQGVKTCYIDQLDQIHSLTLIIHGTKDIAVPPECSRQANARIQGSQLYWMEGCGHWPQRDNPPEFNKVVTDFLREDQP